MHRLLPLRALALLTAAALMAFGLNVAPAAATAPPPPPPGSATERLPTEPAEGGAVDIPITDPEAVAQIRKEQHALRKSGDMASYRNHYGETWLAWVWLAGRPVPVVRTKWTWSGMWMLSKQVTVQPKFVAAFCAGVPGPWQGKVACAVIVNAFYEYFASRVVGAISRGNCLLMQSPFFHYAALWRLWEVKCVR